MGFSAFIPLLRSSDVLVPAAALQHCLDELLAWEHAELALATSERDLTGLCNGRRSSWRAVLQLPLQLGRSERKALSELFLDAEFRCFRHDAPKAVSLETNPAMPLAENLLTTSAIPVRPLTLITLAYRYLRQSNYPAPFSPSCFWVEQNRLVWQRPLVGSSSPTFYGLARGNADNCFEVRSLANDKHRCAAIAYTLIELAHDIRWLASVVFPEASPKRLCRPTNSSHAARLLMARVSEFTANAAEWIVELRETSHRAKCRVDLTERPDRVALSSINEQRAHEVAVWRPRALSHGKQLLELVPDASLRSVAELVARELRKTLEVNVSDAAVYQYLWRELRRSDEPADKRQSS